MVVCAFTVCVSAANGPVISPAEDGSQFSPLTQITKANVGELVLAFEYHTQDRNDGFTYKDHSFQATPSYWNERLFLSTSSGEAIAIDARTGAERWRVDAALDRGQSYSESASRGVALWHGNAIQCPDRVFHGTLDGRLLAIDAMTGELCTGFGANGTVDLKIGIRDARPGDYGITSPVAVLDDRIIVGSAIGDNGAVELEEGVVRALDPVTGEMLWHWDPVPRDLADPTALGWTASGARRAGGANAWAPIAVDPERRLVFVPTSSPSPDFYGGERPGTNAYANAIVVLDADDGSVVWYRQLVHHDVWDYDIPAEPSLTEIEHNGTRQPAVVIATKTAMLFAFHRETGAPLFDIEERPVPQSDVPGEQTHPTQPFSSVHLAPTKPLTEDDAFGIALFDKWGCADKIAEARSEGPFTPPSLRGTLMYPAWTGGINWGGVALDPARQLAIVNFNNLAGLIRLLPRKEFDAARDQETMPDWQLTAMRGSPYGMARRVLLSSLGLPCTAPPWGELAAVDLRTGAVVWRVPFGTIEDLAPAPVPNLALGVPNHGGPLVTAAGLLFIGAAMDHYLRAFDTTSGDELWRHRLPTAAHAIPMSYQIDGQQHIAVAAGGHSGAGSPVGDSLMVFRLSSRAAISR